MLSLLMVLAVEAASYTYADSSPVDLRRPKYGGEPTFTNATLQEMNQRASLDVFLAIAEDKSLSDKSRLFTFATHWPTEMSILKGIYHFYRSQGFTVEWGSHKGQPTVIVSKAGERLFDLQLEWQAIEMHAHADELPIHVQSSAQLQELVWNNLANQQFRLRPHRNFGMGHVQQDLNSSFEDSRGWHYPLHERNLMVFYLSHEDFWPTVGPDIQAKLAWGSPSMDQFQRFLSVFDVWLEASLRGDYSWLTANEASFKDEKLLEALLGFPPGQNYPYALQWQMMNEARDAFIVFPFLRHILQLAFANAFDRKFAFSFNLRNKTFEFRRIPAQYSADDVPMWMALLHRNWARVGKYQTLIALRRPQSQGKNDKLRKFIQFIDSAGMNPNDFRPYLRGKITHLSLPPSNKPLWAEIRTCAEQFAQ